MIKPITKNNQNCVKHDKRMFYCLDCIFDIEKRVRYEINEKTERMIKKELDDLKIKIQYTNKISCINLIESIKQNIFRELQSNVKTK
jgi:hypothetical protein